MKQEALSKKLQSIFLEELEENVSNIEKILLEVVEGKFSPTTDCVNELYRAVHSIKGASATVNADDINKLAHSLEDQLSRLRERSGEHRPDLLEFLYDCVDKFRDMGQELYSASVAQVLAGKDENEKTSMDREEVLVSGSVEAEPLNTLSRQTHANGYIQVSVRRLELMQRMILDLGVNLRGLAASVNTHEKGALPGAAGSQGVAQGSDTQLLHKMREARRVVETLDEEIIKANMQKFSDAFNWLPRVVRDCARKSNKEVRLELSGGEVEVNSALIRALNSPFRHLVRNAIDHGIEEADERQRKGKPGMGVITISVKSLARRLEIGFKDDGRGLDKARIVQAAKDRNLYDSQRNGDDLNLIFESGFSTKNEVSYTSGRGVGLDAVKAAINRYGGSIRVQLDDRNGTHFCINLPINAYRINTLLVSSGGVNFAIDISVIESVVALIDGGEQAVVDGRFVRPEQEPLPILYLERLLEQSGKVSATAPENRRSLVILNYDGQKFAVIVDEVSEIMDAVVRELPRRLGDVSLLQGSILTPTGAIAYVLATADLIARVFNPQADNNASASSKDKRKKKKRILVADDTFTTSALIETILENAGFCVVSARDGEQAWRLMTEQAVDLLVTDFEMPRLDGVSLTRRIRNSAQYKELPVVLLTGRDTEEDKMQGMDAGANAYLMKSTFDQSELLKIIDLLL